jgi:uncharacterized protein (TIGR02147 family)
MSPAAPLPDIVAYAEYRLYLRDRYLAMKARNARFSHRYINAAVGVKSSGWIGDILTGRQKLHLVQVKAIAKAFHMDAREQAFLSVLVEIERAEEPGQLTVAMEKWLALKGPKREIVEKDRFAFFDHWYHLVLREILGGSAFNGDFAALGAALDPPIGALQAKKAFDLLQRLGLILPPSWSRRISDLPVLVKSPEGGADEWNRILSDLMKLSAAALGKFSRAERDFSALTLTLSPEGFRRAAEEIGQMRKRLLLIAEQDRGQDRVFQCLFQMFPVTNTLEGSNA